MCPLGLLVDEKVPLALHSGSGKMRFQLKLSKRLVSAADTDDACLVGITHRGREQQDVLKVAPSGIPGRLP